MLRIFPFLVINERLICLRISLSPCFSQDGLWPVSLLFANWLYFSRNALCRPPAMNMLSFQRRWNQLAMASTIRASGDLSKPLTQIGAYFHSVASPAGSPIWLAQISIRSTQCPHNLPDYQKTSSQTTCQCASGKKIFNFLEDQPNVGTGLYINKSIPARFICSMTNKSSGISTTYLH